MVLNTLVEEGIAVCYPAVDILLSFPCTKRRSAASHPSRCYFSSIVNTPVAVDWPFEVFRGKEFVLEARNLLSL
jgi:hypothetical protein